jgi:hypothetical protein
VLLSKGPGRRGVGEEMAFSDSYLVGFVFMALHLGFEGGMAAHRLLLGLSNMRRVSFSSIDEVMCTPSTELTSLQTVRLVRVLNSMHLMKRRDSHPRAAHSSTGYIS